MYALLLKIVVAREDAAASPASSLSVLVVTAGGTTGTSRFCMHIAQSKIRFPFSIAASSGFVVAEEEGEVVLCVKPMGKLAPDSSSYSSRRMGW